MAKEKPAVKCYRINVDNLDSSNECIQRYELQSHNIYGKDIKEARSKALRILNNEYSIDVDYLDEPLTYVSIKLYRYPDYDKFEYEGKHLTKERIQEVKTQSEYQKSLDDLLANNINAIAYIKKGGYYYRGNNSGYTEYKVEAGIYQIDEAVKHCKMSSYMDCMQAIVINPAEHNKMILDKIEYLKTKLLPNE